MTVTMRQPCRPTPVSHRLPEQPEKCWRLLKHDNWKALRVIGMSLVASSRPSLTPSERRQSDDRLHRPLHPAGRRRLSGTRAEECPHLCQGVRTAAAEGTTSSERHKDGRWLCEGCMESNDGA